MRWLVAACVAVGTSTAWAGYETLYDGRDGATCRHFNAGARLAWQRRGGDWRDARGRLHGSEPLTTLAVRDLDRTQALELDLTSLVRASVQQGAESLQLLLRAAAGGGSIPIHSREARDPAVRPRLVLRTPQKVYELGAEADATLDCTTFAGIGEREIIAPGERSAVLRFDLPRLRPQDLQAATLHLTTTDRQYGAVTLAVYALALPESGRALPVQTGIAARYPGDEGVERDPAVYFAEGFEAPQWLKRWSELDGGEFEVLSQGAVADFEALAGKALRVNVAKGKNLGLNLRYRFAKEQGREPEEIYFRYYLRLGDDWNPTVSGGKLPGIGGTYNRAGWGGRKPDGRDGWSARGEFAKAPLPGNPAHGLTSIGNYAYHADQEDYFGDHWPWNATALGLLERNRWYCVEQYVRLNTPGERDGVVRAWIDGRLAFERTDVRFRNVPTLAIETVWMDVYHGGTERSPADQHLYIDNVVIAREYVGPMAPRR
jgi:hypothetical protein